MRTIKFRAWDIQKKKMIENPQSDDEHTILNYTILDVEKRHVLLEYTGLKDMKGMEIYVGHILQGVGGVKFQVFDGKGGFSINTFQDEIKDGYTGVNALADPQTLSYIESNTEIIGNIYQDTELLN